MTTCQRLLPVTWLGLARPSGNCPESSSACLKPGEDGGAELRILFLSFWVLPDSYFDFLFLRCLRDSESASQQVLERLQLDSADPRMKSLFGWQSTRSLQCLYTLRVQCPRSRGPAVFWIPVSQINFPIHLPDMTGKYNYIPPIS